MAFSRERSIVILVMQTAGARLRIDVVIFFIWNATDAAQFVSCLMNVRDRQPQSRMSFLGVPLSMVYLSFCTFRQVNDEDAPIKHIRDGI
jgi:hypothetical protein